MSAKLKLVADNADASLDALAQVSLEIMRERDNTEREIKALLERGEDLKALQLMRRHLGVEPRMKIAK